MRCIQFLCKELILPAAAAALLLAAAGCTSFSHDWTVAAKDPAPPIDLQGRWEGTWKSDANGHNDKLRCVITKTDETNYLARFHAKYGKALSFGYKVHLTVQEKDGAITFSGDAKLSWLAGGLYHYEGHADLTNFISSYSCKHDHGTFHLTRPQ